MKKAVLVLALAACSSVAFAQTTVCKSSITPAANVTGDKTGDLFVRTTFAPTCSPNTVMVYQQDNAKLWAAAASVKGQNLYGSSTNGGSVGSLGNCNGGKTCGTADATETIVKGASGLAKAKDMGNT